MMNQFQYQTQKGESLTFDKTMLARLPNGENPVYANGAVSGKNLWTPTTTIGGSVGAWSNTTPRYFEENKIYYGLAATNYYAPVETEILQVTNSEITFISKNNGYGVGRAFKIKPGIPININVDKSNYCVQYYTFYTNDGIYITAGSRSTITPPENARWVYVSITSISREPQTVSNFRVYQPYLSGTLLSNAGDGGMKIEGLSKQQGVIQLVNTDTQSVTLVSGNKYITKISDVWSFVTGAGSAVAVTGGTDMVVDLTAMGMNISTVQQFRDVYPNAYYPYSADGKPTPQNPAPIWSVSPRDVLHPVQLLPYLESGNGYGYQSYVTRYAFDSGIVTVTGGSGDTCDIFYDYRNISGSKHCTTGNKYLVSFDVNPSQQYCYINELQGGSWIIRDTSIPANVWSRKEVIFTSTQGTIPHMYLKTGSKLKNWVCIDLTAIYGAGNEPTTVEQFRADYPADYYPYLATANNSRHASIADASLTGGVTIPLPELRGIGDVKDTFEPRVWYNGAWRSRLTRRIGVINSYNGESIGDTWISTTGQLSTGAKVIYPLASPIVTYGYPVQIQQYQGQTNMFSDSIIQPAITATAVKHS